MEIIDIGEHFAFGYYSQTLHKDRPSCTFAFSHLYWSEVTGAYLESCETLNILCRSEPFDFRDEASIHIFQKLLEKEYPDVTFRGIFTTRNFLLTKPYGALKVVGPNFKLDGFANGPMRRIDPVRQPGLRGHLRLVRQNGKPFEMRPPT